MRKVLFALFALSGALCFGQGGASLPNISYSAVLSTTCASTNGACAGAVFAGSNGVPALPQANAGSLGSGSTLDIGVPNYNAALITVNGAYTGSTINFEISDSGGGTFYYQVVCARTDINLLEVNEALPSNTTRAWNCPVWGGYRFRVRQSALATGSVNVTITLTQAAIDPSLVVAASITNIAGASDPCADVSAIKQSSFLNIAAATTSALVAPSGTTNIYVCSYQITSFSTTAVNTVILENGTGAACATSPTSLTPTYTNSGPATIPIIWHEGPGATLFSTGASQGLCALTTVGTAPVIGVKISYVQQ